MRRDVQYVRSGGGFYVLDGFMRKKTVDESESTPGALRDKLLGHLESALRLAGEQPRCDPVVAGHVFDMAQAAATGRGNAPLPPKGWRNCDEIPGALVRTYSPPQAKVPEPLTQCDGTATRAEPCQP